MFPFISLENNKQTKIFRVFREYEEEALPRNRLIGVTYSAAKTLEHSPSSNGV